MTPACCIKKSFAIPTLLGRMAASINTVRVDTFGSLKSTTVRRGTHDVVDELRLLVYP